MKKKPFVSIIICTQNRAEALKKYALNSILKLDYPSYEVVVVDDASKDKTQEILKEFKGKIKNLTIIKNNKARGLCYVRNLGIKYAKGDLIAFTDDDCIVNRNWLKELVEPFLTDPIISVVGGKIFIGNSQNIHNNEKQIFCGNICFKKEIFNKFLFDTDLYFNKCSTHDETELLYRLKKKGFRLFYNNKAIVRHFKEPAEYRKNKEFGEPMNNIYIYAKQTNFILYYFALFYALIKIKRLNYVEKDYDRLIISLRGLKKLFLSKNINLLKIIWILYIILLKIPIKAKSKNWKEEK